MGYLIVFLGGGIGAALRHGFNIAFARLLGTAFPYATFRKCVGIDRDGNAGGHFRFS
jgi:fluoride exporter